MSRQLWKNRVVILGVAVAICMVADYAAAGLSLQRRAPSGGEKVNDLDVDGNTINFDFEIYGEAEEPEYNKEKYELLDVQYRWTVPDSSPSFNITSDPEDAGAWGDHRTCAITVTYAGSGHGGDHEFGIDVEAIYPLNEKGTSKDTWEGSIAVPVEKLEGVNPNQAHFGEWVVGEKKIVERRDPQKNNDPGGDTDEMAYNDPSLLSSCYSIASNGLPGWMSHSSYTWAKGNLVIVKQSCEWKGTDEDPPRDCPNRLSGGVELDWVAMANADNNDIIVDGDISVNLNGHSSLTVDDKEYAKIEVQIAADLEESDNDTYSIGSGVSVDSDGPSASISISVSFGNDTFAIRPGQNCSMPKAIPISKVPGGRERAYVATGIVDSYTAASIGDYAFLASSNVVAKAEWNWEDE